jgi:hypothetical protein
MVKRPQYKPDLSTPQQESNNILLATMTAVYVSPASLRDLAAVKRLVSGSDVRWASCSQAEASTRSRMSEQTRLFVHLVTVCLQDVGPAKTIVSANLREISLKRLNQWADLIVHHAVRGQFSTLLQERASQEMLWACCVCKCLPAILVCNRICSQIV